MNRHLIKGVGFAAVSFTLASYEALFHSPIRHELLIGYALVFAYGILTVLTRHRRPEVRDAVSHDDNSE